MKYTLFALLSLLFVMSCKQKQQNAPAMSEAPAQLFYNGEIIIMQSDNPQYVEAVVEQDGKIP
ncbi:hypothetical protein KUV50_14455 [Membranicola marinus]|uniref:Uncharacterized protein n=1 Tax=Membranihabitans marinus TaxID=1227546 RepID=A0A953HNP6_9BACT|nr:hypothetical protein [Membranihabitans marinus]MBY5959349.1 hypothetical protein [Membranihabitans marinus]